MIQFNLEHYLLDAVNVATNPAYDKTLPEQSLGLQASLGIATNPTDPKRFMLVLSVAVDADKENQQKPPAYTVSISGRAFFAFAETPNKEEAEKFLSLQGASILYGFLRGQVAQLTAQGPHGQMLLPTLNFQELLQTANKNAAGAAAKQLAAP
jgi:preprotein translocase subunit SecB